jgi:uncharacterized protein (DUF2062 family)
MPRKLIKKYMPDEHRFRTHRTLSWLGDHIHDPNLFHLTRKSVSRAVMVGIFCAFLPIPLQMLVAAIIAVVARSNLPISVSLVWLTNPLTMPPVAGRYRRFQRHAILARLPGTQGRGAPFRP